jgi:hypothetical protein
MCDLAETRADRAEAKVVAILAETSQTELWIAKTEATLQVLSAETNDE